MPTLKPLPLTTDMTTIAICSLKNPGTAYPNRKGLHPKLDCKNLSEFGSFQSYSTVDAWNSAPVEVGSLSSPLEPVGPSLDFCDVARYHQKVSNLRSDDVVDALCDENSGEAASEAGIVQVDGTLLDGDDCIGGNAAGYVCWREDNHPYLRPYLEVKFKSLPCYHVPYLG